jgi:hypothetical protein
VYAFNTSGNANAGTPPAVAIFSEMCRELPCLSVLAQRLRW